MSSTSSVPAGCGRSPAARGCAADQARYFLHIDGLVATRHCAYAMDLLSSVTPTQPWGIAQEKPFGWRLYFNGGWGSGTAAIVTACRRCAGSRSDS